MPHEALRTILPVAGWSDKLAATVTFTGGTDPVLPTPFRVGVAGAATLAASGLAAAELWELRTRRRQQVAVDLRQATASLRSGHYMSLGEGKLSAARNSIMGVYPSRDGRWIRSCLPMRWRISAGHSGKAVTFIATTTA